MCAGVTVWAFNSQGIDTLGKISEAQAVVEWWSCGGGVNDANCVLEMGTMV